MECEFLDQLPEKWEPVSRPALVGWLVFYGLFLIYAARASDGLIVDNVNLVVHESGHLLFGWLGNTTIMVAGGTLMQLLVPFLLACFFVFQRQPIGTAFCSFFFFENFLNIAPYMADARAQQLQLVTVGDAEFTIHDWFYLFSKPGLLRHDTQIAALVKLLGWLGMLAVVGWLAWRGMIPSESTETIQSSPFRK
ncbi:MAG TPA: hypothetical protein VG028_12830 [Terriglobia bacterium]|nr:hypothetical protein [Terriglobia bacterium]